MSPPPSLPSSVADELGHYVYIYVNPIDRSVFYVGKGKGARALAHLGARKNRGMKRVLKRIRAAGLEPQIEILAHGLPDSDVARRVEAAAIDLLDRRGIVNRVRGWRGGRFGRATLEEAVARYTRRSCVVREPAILIRINDLYRYGMTDSELYDATRSAWKVGAKREGVQYALAVFEGVVREVYRVTCWVPGGTTFNARNSGRRRVRRGRWEFVGTLAEDSVRSRYLNRFVGDQFGKGAQNPITYVNVS